MNIPVVYEDEWLLAVDKPAGLLSVPNEGAAQRNLTGILNSDLEERKMSYRVYPCHRLDRETSGLVVYAKSKEMQEKVMDLFRDRLVHKKYITFVQGALPKAKGEIKSSIEGKSALTEYKVVQQKSNFSVVEVVPLTGRTNQIRIHFKSIGHPLVGESKFAFRKDFSLKAKRVCLHAGELEFAHPVTKKLVHLSTELPEDLKNFLSKHN